MFRWVIGQDSYIFLSALIRMMGREMQAENDEISLVEAKKLADGLLDIILQNYII